MNDTTTPRFANINDFLVAQGAALRAGDQPPRDRKEWDARKAKLREAMFAAMGPFPEKPCDLEPKIVGTLKRDGYRIEKLLFQSRPDVWVTASAYVPEKPSGKLPAVLVVHGHWAIARRDPVVQARCLGLVHLGYFVLAVDAFGAGERFLTPGITGYHGELIGSTLWPAGQTLVGMQVYDNRRAVDYLLTRPEVDGTKLGITGASGGGNQSMYAGALDERFGAVVPVCSVGQYQAYLRAACCVCEVLPGALRFTEEGDVLGLVAPRALMVVSATKDAYQFSVGQAAISVARAKEIFKLFAVEEKLRHAIFESPHAYNQAMREAMYGWMAKHLKGEGDGQPIPEPKHTLETAEDLACFPGGKRPADFMLPPMYAAREAKRVLNRWTTMKLDHAEGWEAAAVGLRSQLKKQLGDFPKLPRIVAKLGDAQTAESTETRTVEIETEPGLVLQAVQQSKSGAPRKGTCVLLHLDGKAAALKHPLVPALLEKNWTVIAPDLRGTGAATPAGDLIGGAPDHNSAEHAIWIGRPLLGQWVFDTAVLLEWLKQDRVALVGIGQAGIVALCAAGLYPNRAASIAAIESPVTLVTDATYARGTRMGLLAPGLLRAGDVPQLAALCAPRRLVIAGGVTPQGRGVNKEQLGEAYGFATAIYRLQRAADSFRLNETLAIRDLTDAIIAAER